MDVTDLLNNLQLPATAHLFLAAKLLIFKAVIVRIILIALCLISLKLLLKRLLELNFVFLEFTVIFKVEMRAEPSKCLNIPWSVLYIIEGHVYNLPLLWRLLKMLDRVHENLALKWYAVWLKQVVLLHHQTVHVCVRNRLFERRDILLNINDFVV